MGKAKKMKKAAKAKPQRKAATPKRSSPLSGGLKNTAVQKGKDFLFGKSGKGGTGGRRTARQMLKAAYERKARRQIRMGMLGQARRTLRKKATVV